MPTTAITIINSTKLKPVDLLRFGLFCEEFIICLRLLPGAPLLDPNTFPPRVLSLAQKGATQLSLVMLQRQSPYRDCFKDRQDYYRDQQFRSMNPWLDLKDLRICVRPDFQSAGELR